MTDLKRGSKNSSVMKQATIEQWSKVTLSNSFMFRLVMEDKDICKETLELLLDMKIAEIGYLEPEKSLEASLGSKGIRLDIYVKDEAGVVYDLEMQATDKDKDALGKRTRYYQTLIDTSEIKKGVEIKELPCSIVIFICKYDPFGFDFLKYSFKNICLENNKVELNDQSLKIIVNTRGKTDGFSQKVINFIEYINNETVTDDFTQRLNDRVERWRLDEEKARAYMTHEQEIIEAKAEEKRETAEEMLREGLTSKVIQRCTKLSLGQIQEIADKIGVKLVE